MALKRIGLGIATGGQSEVVRGAMGLFNRGGGAGGTDISAELAKIGALIEAQRQAGTRAIQRNTAQQKIAANSSLASRGTYRSPVAENVFGAIRQGESDAISDLEGSLAGQEASIRGQLLGTLLGQQFQERQLKSQQRAALGGLAGSAGLQLLLAALTRNPVAAAPAAAQAGQFLGSGYRMVP